MGVIPDGGEKLAALDRACKKAGEDGLLRELREGTAKPLRALIPVMKDAQRKALPDRGGASRVIPPRTTFRVRRKNSGAYPGVALVASQRGRIQRQDAGILRHPVYADQTRERADWRWVNQRIPKGWATQTFRDAQPGIIREVDAALDRVARQIEIEIGRA